MANTHKLNPRSIASLPPGKHGDGAGLWLYKRPDGGAQWVVRVTVHGKRREMGLGSFPTTSLSEARSQALAARDVARNGRDPIRDRKRKRREAARQLHLFNDVAIDAFESRKAQLKGDGEAGRWFSPLQHHIIPALGNIPIEEIDQNDLRDALSGIWHSKASTAEKALNRTGIVLQHAAALGLNIDLQAPAKARALLGAQRHDVSHISAMPLEDVPGFYARLTEDTPNHYALRLLILTGARAAPVRQMKTEHVNGDVWTIPADLMKGTKGKTKDFRIPLSDEALRVLDAARQLARGEYIFPNSRRGALSDTALPRLMTKMEIVSRPHGFRSTLRDWLSDVEGANNDVAETCLGHVVGSEVERAYRRTDFLEQRRVHMQNWADFVKSQKG